jgi:hypothetical protein
MNDDQFRKLVWYLRGIIVLLAIIAGALMAYGFAPQ